MGVLAVKSVRLFQCLALLATSSTVSAQFASHSGTTTTQEFESRAAFDDLAQFGGCFATRQPKDALRLLATSPGSVDEARVYKELFSKDQYRLGDLSQLSVPWQYVRGAVGEGSFTRRVPLPQAYAAPHSLAPEKVQSVMDAAICYVDRHATEARALIEGTRPETKEETAAMDALWPNFEACLPPNMPKGFKMDSLIVRYRIGEALWRLGLVHS